MWQNIPLPYKSELLVIYVILLDRYNIKINVSGLWKKCQNLTM